MTTKKSERSEKQNIKLTLEMEERMAELLERKSYGVSRAEMPMAKRVQQVVVATTTQRPDQSFTLKEFVDVTKATKAVVGHVIKKLLKDGVIEESTPGHYLSRKIRDKNVQVVTLPRAKRLAKR